MLKHKTIPAGVDQPGFTGVTPSLYAEEHLFSGGTHGALLYRSTLTSDGSGWVTSAPGILMSTGSLEIPEFSTTLPTTVQNNITRLGSIVTAGVFTSTMAITGNTTVGGTFGVTGATTLSSTLAVSGAVTGGTYNGQTISATASFTGSLAVATNATVGGTLGVTGTVTGGTYNGQTISATASFTGSFAVATNATIGGTLGVTGNVTGGTYNSQTISATASFTGTLAVAGMTTATGGIRTASVRIAGIASGVATTMFTPVNNSNVSIYICYANIADSTSNPSNYVAISIVTMDGSTARITSLQTATLMSLTLSGSDVQATQTSGAPQTIELRYLRIL